MENIRYNKTISLALVLLIFITSSAWANTEDIIGSWMGTLSYGNTQVRMAYTIEEDPNGTLSASLHIVDEAVYNIGVDEILFEDNQLTLVCEAVQSTYEGRLIKGRSSVLFDGHWLQSGLTLELDLRPVEEVPRPNRPQDPQDRKSVV